MKKAIICLFLGSFAFVACQQPEKKQQPSKVEQTDEVKKMEEKAAEMRETSKVEVKEEKAPQQVTQEVVAPSSVPAVAPVEQAKQEPITSNVTPEQK